MRWRFVCEDDCLSRGIAWWGNGWRGFAHVDLELSNGGLLGARSDLKGGKPRGVQMRPADYLKGHQIRISVLDFDFLSEKEKAIEEWLLSQVGRKYAMSDIEDFIFGRKTKNNGQWICSALGDECAIQFGLYVSTGVPPSQITPDTLHAILCSHRAHEFYRYEGAAI